MSETVAPATEWAEYVNDDSKSAEENAVLKAEHDKNKPSEKAEPFVPLARDAITLPKGFVVDDATMDKFLGVMNDQNLTPQARAQALVDLQSEATKAASERASELWENLQTTWRDEAKADPTIGGAKLEPALREISKMVDAHGSPELRQVLDQTGAGNNVHVISFFAKLAGLVNESGPVQGSTPSTERTQAEIMFPNMAKG